MTQRGIDDPASPYVPYGSRGRPHPRWDDKLTAFCERHIASGMDWMTAILQFNGDFQQIEDLFVIFANT